MIDILKPLIQQFMPFAQQQMGFSRPPRLFLRQDQQNADNPMGKTGFYDPQAESITLYTTGRHPKDIMRSLAHELMHHTQKCNGDFDNVTTMGEEGYAQSDPHMRNMEIEAYQASIVFRDWEDSTKGTIYYEHLQKGDKSSMSTKNWKNGELKSLLSEAWGFKMDLSKLNDKKTHKKVLNENNEDIFAPNHYCVHHGGVQHNGSIEMAEAVKHNYNQKLGRVTHYDMKLADGTILENVAAEDIQITNASLAEAHDSPGKRDDDRTGSGVDHGGDDDEEAKEETEGKADSKREEKGLDEASRTDRPDRAREEGGRRVDEAGCPMDDEGDMEVMVVDDDMPEQDDPQSAANELLSLAQRIADMLGQESEVSSLPDEEEIVGEESWPGKRDADQHKSDLSEAQIRRIVRKVLKETRKKGK